MNDEREDWPDDFQRDLHFAIGAVLIFGTISIVVVIGMLVWGNVTGNIS